MSNMALYNKWRAQTFDEILGQEHVTRTLQNQIRSGRIGHAYLFTGLRGTGKTSIARVFARAINCIGDTDTPPCNQCHICTSLLEGRSLDLTEIDGASNRGIEEIRDLRDKVNFAPNECRYKVYVIDEVHMLTREAFNALLKTLEEPPAHVVFIFCTTEPYRLPDTVLSRCQRFDLRRGSLEDIQNKLTMICKREGLEIEEKALAYIARRGAGSYRDAESLLDQLSSYEGSRITLEQVQALLGSTSSDLVIGLVRAIVSGDAAGGIEVVREAFDAGAEPRQFLADIVEALRALMLLRVGSSAESTAMTPEDIADLRALVQAGCSLGTVLRAIKLFTEAGQGLRHATRPEIPIELALVEAAMAIGQKHRIEGSETVSKPAETPPTERTASRPRSSRPQARETVTSTAEEPRTETPATYTVKEQVQPIVEAQASVVDESIETLSQPAATPDLTLDWVQGHWRQVLIRMRSVNRQVEALLHSVRPVGVQDGVVIIGCEADFHRDKLQQDERRTVLEGVLSEVLGTPCRVTCTTSSGAAVREMREGPADLFSAPDPKKQARDRLLSHPAIKEAERLGMKITDVHIKEDLDQEEDSGK